MALIGIVSFSNREWNQLVFLSLSLSFTHTHAHIHPCTSDLSSLSLVKVKDIFIGPVSRKFRLECPLIGYLLIGCLSRKDS